MNSKLLLLSGGATVVVYAIIHSIAMGLYVLKTGKITTINGFTILGINLFFPGIENGIVSFIISWMFMILLYSIVFLYLKKNS
jgi:hypothetical protein